MGLRHGLSCLGCCWALMAVMYVVGVMNLMWMALLGILMLIEKVWKYGQQVRKISGARFIIMGRHCPHISSQLADRLWILLRSTV